jgi:hypothetical protein
MIYYLYEGPAFVGEARFIATNLRCEVYVHLTQSDGESYHRPLSSAREEQS